MVAYWRSNALQNALEHSAILLTFIKRYFVLKSIYGLFESGRFTQVLLHGENCILVLSSEVFS